MSLVTILGGLALFLFGIGELERALQRLAGDRLRRWLGPDGAGSLKAVGVGVGVTVLLQNSNTTSVMLVGLADSSVVTLSRAMAVLLGADVGMTTTVQMVAFRVTDLAPLGMALGLGVSRLTRARTLRALGEGLFGLGCIFLAMRLMAEGAAPLVGNPLLKAALGGAASSPVAALVGASLFTALVQSSAAVVGICVALAQAGALPIEAAVPIVLGANVGTASTALMASVRSRPPGRRVAWAHLVLKLTGVAVVLPFLGVFDRWVAATSADPGRQVANAHTLFNLGLVVLFLPLIPVGVRLLTRLVPDRPEERGEFQVRYMTPQAAESPSLAFAAATREILRMADVVGEMLRSSIQAFEGPALELADRIAARDDVVDFLNQQIKLYLARIAHGNQSEEETQREFELIHVVTHLESIGDVIDKNLMELARKKAELGVQFSEEGGKEIRAFHAEVVRNFEKAMAAFASSDANLAREVVQAKEHIHNLERSLNQAHIRRLNQGLRESIETSAIHLDILTNLRRINSYITNCVYPTLDRAARATA